jgi:hypothetical protein
MLDTRGLGRGRQGRRAASERLARPLLTAAERATAHAIATHILDLREAGAHNWDAMLIDVDKRWPGAKYRTVLTALFLGQLAWERRRSKAALQ